MEETRSSARGGDEAYRGSVCGGGRSLARVPPVEARSSELVLVVEGQSLGETRSPAVSRATMMRVERQSVGVEEGSSVEVGPVLVVEVGEAGPVPSEVEEAGPVPTVEVVEAEPVPTVELGKAGHVPAVRLEEAGFVPAVEVGLVPIVEVGVGTGEASPVLLEAGPSGHNRRWTHGPSSHD